MVRGDLAPSLPMPGRCARRLYDFMSSRSDWMAFYESRSKTRALELLDMTPGLRLLNVGVGTGKDHRRIQARLTPEGIDACQSC